MMIVITIRKIRNTARMRTMMESITMVMVKIMKRDMIITLE